MLLSFIKLHLFFKLYYNQVQKINLENIIDLKNAVIDVDYDKIAIRIVKELKEFYNV